MPQQPNVIINERPRKTEHSAVRGFSLSQVKPMTLSRITNLICLVCLTAALAPRLSAQGGPQPVRAKHGMVASAEERASQVGVEILKKGGNAVDAAVATGLALAVTYPAAGNLGGGGFMMIRMADGRAVAIDYREIAPALATHDMYLDKAGRLTRASLEGPKASGVPGTVAGLAMALEKYGTMKWADVVEPARRLAAEGFTASYPMARSLRSEKVLTGNPESRRIFLKEGKRYAEGEIFRQPELAATLERLKTQGPREFYEGPTAHLIADEMKRGDGLISLEDLKNYRPQLREPLRGTYRGYEIITMPPPSSGGAALLEMLNILERYNLTALGHTSSAGYHLLIEAMRRAFADRAEFMGDPDFVKMPVRGLISKQYARGVSKTIDADHASSSKEVGHGAPGGYESPQTTHFSVVDAQGNAVANTYTLNAGYGSGITVKGAGFLLNNEMDDFAGKPGSPNGYGLIQGEVNSIAPRKRPLSSMTPTIVLKDGKLFLVLGSPGGPTIINSVLQVILNVIDHRMNIRQAVEAPRIHHQWMPDEVKQEPFGLAKDVIDALKAKGHVLSDGGYIGDVQAIMVDTVSGDRLGASDSRSAEGRAIGH
jgi:gamma-glutamyltranspeptidase/glutathione hydrolase